MQIARYLKPEHVQVGLVNGHRDAIDPTKDLAAERRRLKEEVVGELVELFMKTGQVRNQQKFHKDLLHRERKATTAVGNGIAIPHVRSQQPKKVAVIFARSHDGVEFESLDGERTHVFFGITAPPYDDKVFLQFYQWIAQRFLQEDWLPQALLSAEDEHEIIKILTSIS